MCLNSRFLRRHLVIRWLRIRAFVHKHCQHLLYIPEGFKINSFTSEDAEVKEFSHIPITHLPNLFESSTPILEDSKEEVAPMIPGSTYNHNIPITYIPDLFNTKDSTSKGLKASNTALDYDTAIMPDAFSDIASLSEGYETAASSLDELPPTFQLFTFPISFNRVPSWWRAFMKFLFFFIIIFLLFY